MIKFLYLLSVTVFYAINYIECSNIHDALRSYYDSDATRQFKEEWKKYQHAFETEMASVVIAFINTSSKVNPDNCVHRNLRESFGHKAMNIYEPDQRDAHLIAEGFHLTDGVVLVYFFEMVLRELPNLLHPKLTMDLPSNFMKFESKVGRMFIDTTYYVARNSSTVIYARPEDQKELSPFSLQQVDNLGKVVIVVEDCLLSGISIATLSGDSVNLGHSAILLSDCKFMVEISTPNSGAPPVIAPYFPKGPKEKLELVVSKPLREEFHTKLQGAMYSYINTSVLLGKQASDFRNHQEKLFKSYGDFMTDFVAKLNQKTLQNKKGNVGLPNYEILMNTETDKREWQCHMALREVMLYGLDTAYVARVGGPYNEESSKTAADAIVFSSMQIRGKISHDDGDGSITYDFAAELTDITVDIIIDIEEGKTKLQDIVVTGWRSLEFSIIPWETKYKERHGYQSMVYGHILNELPVRVTEHLTSILGAPLDVIKKDDDGADGGGSDDNEKEGNDINNMNKSVDNNDYEEKTTVDQKGNDKNKNDFFSDDLDENFFSDGEFFSDDAVEKDFLSEFETDGNKDNNEGVADVDAENKEPGGIGEGVDDDAVADEPNVANTSVPGEDDMGDNKADLKTEDNLNSVNGEESATNVELKDDAIDSEVQIDKEDVNALDMSVEDESVAGNDNNIQSMNEDGGSGVADDDLDETVAGEASPSGTYAGGDDEAAWNNGDKDKNVKEDGFLSDGFIDKDFFSDDNIKEDFISDMSENNNKALENKDKLNVENHYDINEGAVKTTNADEISGEVAEDKKETVLSAGGELFNDKNKNFMSAEHIQKDFLSDDNLEENFFSDDNIEKDFFSDDNIEKDFISDNEKNVASTSGKILIGKHKDYQGDSSEIDDVTNTKANILVGKEKHYHMVNQATMSDEDNNRDVADDDDDSDKDHQNAGETSGKKLWVFASAEDKPFLDEKFFSDDEIERRSKADGSRRQNAKTNGTAKVRNPSNEDHVNDKLAATIEVMDSKLIIKGKEENSQEVKKVALPSNVHNYRRQQNMHLSENEIR